MNHETTTMMKNEATIMADDVNVDDNDNDNGQQYYVRSARIQMRLILSLMFAFLPGVTQLPLMARSAIVATPTTTVTVTNIAAPAPSASLLLDQEEISRRRSADAARLLLDTGGDGSSKRYYNSERIKKQMDMQDRRLENCQESSEAGNWEQCFFYGTDTATSNFDDEMGLKIDDKKAALSSSSSSSFSKASVKTGYEKSKIPTW